MYTHYMDDSAQPPNPAAQALGKLGGHARAKKLTPARRRAIAAAGGRAGAGKPRPKRKKEKQADVD